MRLHFLGVLLLTSGDFPCRPSRPQFQRICRAPAELDKRGSTQKAGGAEPLHSRKGSLVCKLTGGRLHSRRGFGRAAWTPEAGWCSGLGIQESSVLCETLAAAYIEFNSILVPLWQPDARRFLLESIERLGARSKYENISKNKRIHET